MASTIPPPPPPPPISLSNRSPLQHPKPGAHGAAATLARGAGTPANSDNVSGLRASVPSDRGGAPKFKVDPATLQHASASLRKTQYHQPIPPSELPESGHGRPSLVPPRGHRPTDSEYARLDVNPTGAPLHASHTGTHASATLPKHDGRFIPIIHQQQPGQTPVQQQSNYSSSSYDTSTNYNSVPPPLPSQPPPSSLLSSQPPPNQTYSSYSTYSYVDPQNYTIKETYQSPPTNNNGIHSYKTYSSTASTRIDGGGNSAPESTQQQPSGYIINPKSYIHDYATRTPAAVLAPPPPQQPSHNNSSSYSYSYSSSSSNNNTNSAPKQSPLSYAEELRNSTLSERQRQSNQFQRSSALSDRQAPKSLHNLYEERIQSNKRTDLVDDLARDMEMRFRASGDICAKCNSPIVGDTPGVTALGKPYHVNCFTCDACQKQLAGCSFYNVDGKNLCQVDYMNSLEKCEKCATPITQKILRALGKPFHPECFACPNCNKSLDGIPFTVSKENVAYCLDCYHEQFSPRCAVCLKAIAPSGNETEVARVIAMNKSYHTQCYRCEDCGLQLNSKVEGAACYPLESHLFCKNCNLNRLKAIS